MPDEFLPVCRPGLPAADALLPYLRQIDAARHYTNRGPLVRLLEQRLAQTLGLPDHGLRSASNGTSAIEIAILAAAGPATPARPLALIPPIRSPPLRWPPNDWATSRFSPTFAPTPGRWTWTLPPSIPAAARSA